MELFFVLLVGAGVAYGIYRSSQKKQRRTGFLSGADKVDLDSYEAPERPEPPRPSMTPPADGALSVAIQQADNAVWVWILVSEVTKQTLSKVMKQPVDEYPLRTEATQRIEQSMREHLNAVDGTFRSARERQEYISDFRKKMMTPANVTLRDMLRNPFKYPVSNAQEAADYIERLKTKVFPKIKGMIEAQSRPKTESFEL